jgi:hypothetical protein
MQAPAAAATPGGELAGDREETRAAGPMTPPSAREPEAGGAGAGGGRGRKEAGLLQSRPSWEVPMSSGKKGERAAEDR